MDKILNDNEEPTSRRGIDNHFPTSEEIKQQMENMKHAKKSKEKDEKEKAHRILKGNK